MAVFTRSKSISYTLYAAGLLFGICLTGLWLRVSFFTPVKSGADEIAPFLIERNWSIRTVAQELEKQGFVRHWWAVYFLARINKSKLPTVKPGEYALSYGLTPKQLLEKLINEEIVYHQLTIPEGSNLRDVANFMAGTTLLNADQAMRALRDRALLSKLEIYAETAEGYLFPDTYRFTRADDAEFMITALVKNGEKKWTKEMYQRVSELGFSMHQVLTLASIIEKETGSAAERKLVSSVLHNRLKLGMPLQADPTVIYGIANFDGNLTREHLATPGPYNTYINTGLPPGPICNPGLESITAALFPADTDYLYFVAKGDGSSHYSATYREHQEAVRKYQISRRDNDLKQVLGQ